MVKIQVKPLQTKPNPLISSNQVPKLDNKLSNLKSRRQINQENYQKNKAKRNDQAKARYQQRKEQEQLTAKQSQVKYYGAEAIKILMTFKEYTELNQQKHKLWLDFNWTLKDCVKEIQEGFGNVVAIMKLEQVASNLVRDYWETTKGEIQKGKSWNSLSEEQQQKLIRYWGYEKARIENGYLDTAEQLEKQSQTYLKKIELAKFHEERGKEKCPCYQCQESKKLQGEIKAEIFKESEAEKVQCPECKKWVKNLDEESGVCRSCKRKYE